MHKSLLSPWEKRCEQDWVPLKEIMVKATNGGLKRRTVFRHLENGTKFEKESRGYNKTFYRPTQGFWSWILHESLKTEDSFEEERIVVWMKAKEGVDAQFDKLQEWYFEDYEKIIKERKVPEGGTGLSPENYQQLDDLVNRLLQILESSLAVDFIAEGGELEDIYRLLVKNVAEFLSAYTSLWVFNSKTYAAPKNFSEQLKYAREALNQFRQDRNSRMP